jgi:pre-mRNA-processing factor 40
VPSETERSALFTEAMRSREKREREEAKAELRARRASVRDLLAGLSAADTWRAVAARLEGQEAWEACDRADRLELFQEAARAAQAAECAEAAHARDAQQRSDRRARDAFKAMLRRHWCVRARRAPPAAAGPRASRRRSPAATLHARARAQPLRCPPTGAALLPAAAAAAAASIGIARAEGRIQVKTRWPEYGPAVEGEPESEALRAAAGGSRPRELFEDLIEEQEEAYERLKPELKEAARAAGVKARAAGTAAGRGNLGPLPLPQPLLARYLCPIRTHPHSSVRPPARRKQVGPEDAAPYFDFAAALRDAGGPKVVSAEETFMRTFYEETVGKARQREKDAAKRRRAREKFSALLANARDVDADTSWEWFKKEYRSDAAFQAAGTDAKDLFYRHRDKLAAARPASDAAAAAIAAAPASATGAAEGEGDGIEAGGSNDRKRRSSGHGAERGVGKRVKRSASAEEEEGQL